MRDTQQGLRYLDTGEEDKKNGALRRWMTHTKFPIRARFPKGDCPTWGISACADKVWWKYKWTNSCYIIYIKTICRWTPRNARIMSQARKFPPALQNQGRRKRRMRGTETGETRRLSTGRWEDCTQPGMLLYGSLYRRKNKWEKLGIRMWAEAWWDALWCTAALALDINALGLLLSCCMKCRWFLSFCGANTGLCAPESPV